MAQETYWFYLESYIQTHQQRFQYAMQLAAAEKAALLDEEKFIRDYILELQKQKIDLQEAAIKSTGGDSDSFNSLYKIITNSQDKQLQYFKVEETRKKEVARDYTELPPSVATSIVSNTNAAIEKGLSTGNYDGEIVEAAEMARAALPSETEGQRLQAASSFYSTMQSRLAADPSARGAVTDARLKEITKAAFLPEKPVTAIGQTDFYKQKALERVKDDPEIAAQLAGIEKDERELRAAIGGIAADPDAAAAMIKSSKEGMDDIDELIAAEQERLATIREKRAGSTIERGREIYQEQFAPVKVGQKFRERKKLRATELYDSLNTEEKLIAGALSREYSDSVYDKYKESQAGDEVVSLDKASLLFSEQLANPNPDLDVYAQMRKLLAKPDGTVDDEAFELALRKGIEDYKKTVPKDPARPADVLSKEEFREQMLREQFKDVPETAPPGALMFDPTQNIGVRRQGAPPTTPASQPPFPGDFKFAPGAFGEELPPPDQSTAPVQSLEYDALGRAIQQDDELLAALLERFKQNTKASEMLA